MQNKFGKKTYSRLLIVLALAAAVFIYILGRPSEAVSKETATVPEYSALAIKAGDVPITTSYIGYVTPINSVDIMPYVNGYLDKILVTGGQEVKAGDTMIIIEQSEYKAKLDATKAAVLQAEANYNNAKIYYERIKKAGDKAVSKTEVDNAKASYLSAEAALSQAKANRSLAQVTYNYTIIKAPINGMVGNVSLTKGDYVAPGSNALLSIIQYNPIRIVFSITDKEYLDEIAQNGGALFQNEKIKLKLANGKTFEKTGKFQFTDNSLNKNTNSLSVYADFDNADKELIANAYVDVLVEKVFKNGVIIPRSLVSMQPEGDFVYTVKDNRLNQTKIDVIAELDNDNYLVRNNFATNEFLVTDQVSRFTPNQQVRIKPAVNLKLAEKK